MRARDIWVSMLRLGFATAGVAAMTYQFAVLDERGSLRLGNLFGFFTIQSNIFAVLLLMAAAVLRKPERTVLFAQCSLYDPTLDLAVGAADGQAARMPTSGAVWPVPCSPRVSIGWRSEGHAA